MGHAELTPRPSLVKKALIITAGVLLILLGIVGLFLPFLQGLLFIFIGLSIVATQVPLVKGWMNRLEARFPGPHRHARRAGRWCKAKLGIAEPDGPGDLPPIV